MQYCKPQCFSHPDVLEAASPKWLVRFLQPHSAFLESKGLMLPDPTGGCEDLDCQELLRILMTPDPDMPRDLIDSLYHLHEMATPEGMDCLLAEADAQSVAIDSEPDPTPLDVAIQVWLQDEDLVKHQHADRSLKKPYGFVYFESADKPDHGDFWTPDAGIVRALEGDLAGWFERRNRGNDCRVTFYRRESGIWFVVGHGEPTKRQGCVCKRQHGNMFYRPERHDLVVYQPSTGELRVHAGTRATTQAYRKLFGRHFFGNDRHFSGTEKYTLDPLKTVGEKSLVCSDVEGMEAVRLHEVSYLLSGAYGECESHGADDVFAAMKERCVVIPEEARITRACFSVVFSDSDSPREVSIQPSNVAGYQRDSDCERTDPWLLKRGFALLGHLLFMLTSPWFLQMLQDSDGALSSIT